MQRGAQHVLLVRAVFAPDRVQEVVTLVAECRDVQPQALRVRVHLQPKDQTTARRKLRPKLERMRPGSSLNPKP